MRARPRKTEKVCCPAYPSRPTLEWATFFFFFTVFHITRTYNTWTTRAQQVRRRYMCVLLLSLWWKPDTTNYIYIYSVEKTVHGEFFNPLRSRPDFGLRIIFRIDRQKLWFFFFTVFSNSKPFVSFKVIMIVTKKTVFFYLCFSTKTSNTIILNVNSLFEQF